MSEYGKSINYKDDNWSNFNKLFRRIIKRLQHLVL